MIKRSNLVALKCSTKLKAICGIRLKNNHVAISAVELDVARAGYNCYYKRFAIEIVDRQNDHWPGFASTDFSPDDWIKIYKVNFPATDHLFRFLRFTHCVGINVGIASHHWGEAVRPRTIDLHTAQKIVHIMAKHG